MSRNGGYDRYRAALADENAWARARRPKCCKLANSPQLRQAVAGKLRLDWSPEQIAGWLKRMHPEDECNQVSHETIYRSLFVQTRGVLKKELLSHLRSKRSMRRSKPVDPDGDSRGHIKDIVSIRQRPLLSDQHDQPLPAGDAGVEKVPLQHGVVLRHDRDDYGGVFRALGFMNRGGISGHQGIEFAEAIGD